MKFRFLTAGESHGKCLCAIIEGMVAGLDINFDKINEDLSRRQQGKGRGGRIICRTIRQAAHPAARIKEGTAPKEIVPVRAHSLATSTDWPTEQAYGLAVRALLCRRSCLLSSCRVRRPYQEASGRFTRCPLAIVSINSYTRPIRERTVPRPVRLLPNHPTIPHF